MASRSVLPLDPALRQYLMKYGLRSNPILQRLRKETEKLPNAIMTISDDELHFLQFLLKLIQAKKVIEIGTFTGLSTLGMALAIADDGKVIGCDINESYANIGKPYWKEAGVEHKIDLKIQPAIETLDQLIDNAERNTFDFIFIDADKCNYCNYYERSVQLIRKDGIIAVDNTLWSGKVADKSAVDPTTESIREVNMRIKEDSRVEFILLTVSDGLTLVRKI